MRQMDIILNGLTLWLTSMVFLFRLKHKGNFQLRSVLWLFSCIVGVNFIGLVEEKLRYVPLVISMYYVLILCAVFFLAEIDWTAMVYAVVCISMVECIFDSLYQWMWKKEHGMQLPIDFEHIVSYVLIYAAGCSILFFSVAKWMFRDNFYAVGPRQLLSAVMLSMISNYLYYYVNELISLEQYPVNLLLQVYCVTVLYLQNALFRESAVSHELEQMDWMWHQHQMQYQLSKETIAQLNQKSHDLKYKVEALRGMDDSEEKKRQLDEMKQTAQIYDHIMRTGNEVLDVILTEKSLYCQSEQILIHCIADGKILHFMNSVDLYTVFGNAIDNAIESVSTIQDEEKRSIDILIHKKQQFAVIVVRNPSQSLLKYKEGKLVSSKPEQGYHGFGVRSIKHIAAKYNGKAVLEQEGDIVTLRIVIPIPDV